MLENDNVRVGLACGESSREEVLLVLEEQNSA